ncbi:hypothetical protein [Flavobacterium sp. SM2513]|uniref:hypothetical protein n=1 Tax=Flavobacterium sp. SM2513 TaxID=3424766 RepID=UPI003D7FFADE
MKNKLLFVLLLFTSVLMAQKLPREILYGQLVADSTGVENVLVTNKTAKLAVYSRSDGTFQIHVREKDTLIFSNLNFPVQSLILNEADLKLKLLKIKIESRPNQLDEVIINPNALSGNLEKDNENIKVTQLKPKIDNLTAIATLYEDDVQSSPDNKLMPGYLDTRYMMDFQAIGVKLIRSLKSSEAQRNKNKDISRFSVIVQNRFSPEFFRNNFKMDKKQTEAFLNFCESDPNAKELTANGNDFELIDFLMLKKQEYTKFKKE